MRFASLGSGSEGNALLIECSDGSRVVRILLDCGFGLKEVRRRLELLGLHERQLDGILVTHEHSDHVGGAFRLAAAAQTPLHLTWGTMQVAMRPASLEVDCKLIDPGKAFEIGGIVVKPFAVPHDAREPVQFVFDDGRRRLGVLTDIGMVTQHVQRELDRLDALVLECNHDETMLAQSSYPWSLKKRIAGDYGHLSNDAAAKLLAGIDHSRLRHVAAAHLSQQNNHPDLARAALARAWGVDPSAIDVADQDSGLRWIELK